MIDVKSKEDCCGCHACASACAHRAITMQADAEGFLYPIVDKDACTNCGVCEQVCPIVHQSSPTQPLKVYAARSYDEELRRQSSSGGIFTLLAEAVIREGGVAFGAKFDKEWNVIHSWADTIEELAPFRGSKYVQSTIGNTCREAKKFLQQGRKVLFTGTPCQIAGLKRYLCKDYDNLLAADVICHGVPSPIVWKRYLDEMRTMGEITDISFRDKTNGWARYGFRLCYSTSEEEEKVFLQPFLQNTYMRGFLSDLYLRPSCYACPFRTGKSGSDITLGDFWGIGAQHPEMDDNGGTSALIVNSDKGISWLMKIKANLSPTTLQAVEVKNPALYVSCKPHRKRSKFFPLKSTDDIDKHIQRLLKPTLWENINQKWFQIKQQYKLKQRKK